ncbi:MAG: hypothetical protein ACHQ4G_09800 [Opitutales bacterium]
MRPTRRNLSFALVLLAVLAAAGWLWVNFCRFPASCWNDIRLVPVFMAAAGEPVYTLPGHGVITTWMYGPVPIWIWSPALLGGSAVSAVMIADAVNLLLTLAAIALTCAYWPAPGANRTARWLAFAAAITVWPDHAFRFLQADNVAVVFGLIANLLLVTGSGAPRSWRAWLAGAATAVALGCKQTTLGLLLAQLVWLGWEYHGRAAWVHLGRTLAIGAVLALSAGLQFGFGALWFGTVSIASALPTVADSWGQLGKLAPFLAVQWGGPMLVIAVLGRSLFATRHPLRLPLLAWGWSLPLGLAGLLTTGGSINNLQGFHLLAPALLVVLFGAAERRELVSYRAWAAAAILGIVLLRILRADQSPVRPATVGLKQAAAIEAAFPGQVWLPWNPLVSWFAERRFYHAEDGLYVRFITGHPVSLAQARAHLPPDFHAMAFPTPRMQWGVAAKLAGPGSTIHMAGPWELIEWPARKDP